MSEDFKKKKKRENSQTLFNMLGAKNRKNTAIFFYSMETIAIIHQNKL
jgi:hypothetical protein